MRKEKNKLDKPVKEKKGHKKTIFLVLLITLFCTSFVATAYMIINANQLTFKTQETGDEVKQRIEDLEKQIAEKDALIEELTLQSTDKSSFSSSGAATQSGAASTKTTTSGSAAKSTATPTPASTPTSTTKATSSPTPSASSSPAATSTNSSSPTATPANSSSPTITPSVSNTPTATPKVSQSPSTEDDD